MLNKLSKKLAASLISAGADASKHAVYAYGIECTLSTAIILFLLAVGGIIMGKFLHVLVFTAFWLPLRILVGGAHANSHFMCTVVSVGLGIISAALSKYVNVLPVIVILAITILSYIVIFLLTPVVHKNHPISNSHRLKMRRIARIFGAIECAFIILLRILNTEMFATAFMGCFTTAVLAVIGYFGKSALRTFE